METKKYKVAVEGFEMDGAAYEMGTVLDLENNEEVQKMVDEGSIVEEVEGAADVGASEGSGSTEGSTEAAAE